MSHHDGLEPSHESPEKHQITPDERLEQAIVFLSEEDAHLRLGFDRELAEIEREILLKYPLQQVKYNPGLYAQLRSMIAVHKRRAASLKADAGHTPVHTPVPFFSSNLSQVSGVAGRDPSIGHHEDHPPFTLESSPESYDFVEQIKSNTPQGRELRKLDRHAFTAALRNPALIQQPLQTEGSMENRAIQRGRRRAALQTALRSFASTAITDSDCGEYATLQGENFRASFPTVLVRPVVLETQKFDSRTTSALGEFQDLAIRLFNNIYYAGLCDIVPSWLTGKPILSPEGKALQYLFFEGKITDTVRKTRVQLLVDPSLDEMMRVIDYRDHFRYPDERRKGRSPLSRRPASAEDLKPALRETDYTLIHDRYRSVHAQWATMWAVIEKTSAPDGDNVLKSCPDLDPQARHELLQIQNLPQLLPSAFRKREVNKAEEDATRLYAYLFRHYEKEIMRDLVPATQTKPPSSAEGAAPSTDAVPSGTPHTPTSINGSGAAPGVQDSSNGGGGSSSGNGSANPPQSNSGASNGGKEPGDEVDNPPRPEQVPVQPPNQKMFPRVAEWGEIWHADFPPIFPFGETEYIRNIMSRQVTWDLAQGALCNPFPSPPSIFHPLSITTSH